MSVAGSIVVKLLIQPIIENYIVHGFRPNDDDNRISITAAEQEKHILIRVKDNGKGIGEEKLTELRKALKNEGEAPSGLKDSLGLKNVHERIRLNYGSEFGISVISEQDKGCEVIIKIPFTRED
ncbi:putative sensor-like histidine kinase [compost metagenome]